MTFSTVFFMLFINFPNFLPPAAAIFFYSDSDETFQKFKFDNHKTVKTPIQHFHSPIGIGNDEWNRRNLLISDILKLVYSLKTVISVYMGLAISSNTLSVICANLHFAVHKIISASAKSDLGCGNLWGPGNGMGGITWEGAGYNVPYFWSLGCKG